MDYFDKAETWDRATLETVQLARLKTTIQQASRAPFYAKRLAEAGVSADNLRSLEDIRRIPFTSKDDLRSQYPYGLATVPHSEFVRMHCSSGTTGTPVAVCYTQSDINSWADLMARCLYMAGVRKDDVFQNMSGYGLFTGGLNKFDEYYEKGFIDRILTTNLVYQTPDLLQRPYYINVDMSKYIALIIDNLNHDASLSELLTPTSRINRLLEQYRS